MTSVDYTTAFVPMENPSFYPEINFGFKILVGRF